MPVVRRFLIASALTRLVRKERGSGRVTEGYFPSQGGRASHVQVDGAQCHLVLVTAPAGEVPTEERTEVPRAHADALLDVCPGKVQFERSRLAAGGREIFVDRFSTPALLDLVTVPFETAEEVQAFHAPAWFGPEVTTDTAFASRAIALEGSPSAPEVELSNASLESLLDVIENRFGTGRFGAAPSRLAGEDTRVMDALRRLAGGGATLEQASRPAPEPFPAPEPLPTSEPLPAATLPDVADTPLPEPVTSAADDAPAADADFRMDDVLQGLSQVLEAYSDTPPREPPAEAANEPAPEVDRWRSRASRRSEG